MSGFDWVTSSELGGWVAKLKRKRKKIAVKPKSADTYHMSDGLITTLTDYLTPWHNRLGLTAQLSQYIIDYRRSETDYAYIPTGVFNFILRFLSKRTYLLQYFLIFVPYTLFLTLTRLAPSAYFLFTPNLTTAIPMSMLLLELFLQLPGPPVQRWNRVTGHRVIGSPGQQFWPGRVGSRVNIFCVQTRCCDPVPRTSSRSFY